MRTLFPLPPPQSEADIRNEMRAELERLGMLVFRVDTTFGRRSRNSSTKGWPDLMAVIPPSGRLIGVECKKPGAPARANEAKQNEVIARLRASGVIVIVARSLLELKAALAASTLAVTIEASS